MKPTETIALTKNQYLQFIARHDKCDNDLCKKDIEFCRKQLEKMGCENEMQ